MLADVRYLAENAAGGHHLITDTQACYQRLVRLLFLLLRTNQQKIEGTENYDHR